MSTLGGDLIREARRRAGLTQAELAVLAGTSQSGIARWEAGRTAVSLDDAIRLVRLCGFDLEVMLLPRDDERYGAGDSAGRPHRPGTDGSTRAVGAAADRASPAATTADMELDLARLLEALDRHKVAYVLIGGLAAVYHGSPFPTEDADITPQTDRANLERLAAALVELDARIRTDAEPAGLPFTCDADSLAALKTVNLTTAAGDLDLTFEPAGTAGYDDLRRDATRTDLYGVTVQIASLADVIRSKQAANRPKDQRVLPTLREILSRRAT